MDQQVEQQVEQQLRRQWTTIKYQILERFPQVTVADLDSATSVPDLVESIADLTRHSRTYIEGKLTQLVGTTAATVTSGNGQERFRESQQQMAGSFGGK